MKKDEDLQNDVQEPIKLEVLLNAADLIGVIAKDGVITLKGVVDTLTKKTKLKI